MADLIMIHMILMSLPGFSFGFSSTFTFGMLAPELEKDDSGDVEVLVRGPGEPAEG